MPWPGFGALGCLILLAGCGGRPPAESAAQQPAPPDEGPLFVDVAAPAGVPFAYFLGRTGGFHTTEVTAAGVATLDYNGDGLFDLYFPQGGMLGNLPLEQSLVPPPAGMLPLTDRLYRNESVAGPDGTLELHFRDVTAEAGISELGYSMGVATGDINNDGHVDLYVTNVGSNSLLRNRGDGTFEAVASAGGADSALWSVPAAFLDYNRDGFLDLFVGNYVEWKPEDPKRCYRATGSRDYCGPLAYREAADRLFRNRGDGSFEDVTATAGLNTVFGSALGAVVFDADGDGLVDIYVSNDGRPNQLWINRGDGTFGDEAPTRGAAVNSVGYAEAGMGVEAADLDADGDFDIFLAHLTGETNTLYLNDGSGMFDDRSTASGLAVPSKWATAFGNVAFDFDNDGLLDLFTANGEVRVNEEQARAGITFPLRQRNQLYRNLGGGRFEEVLPERAGTFLAEEAVSRGAVPIDLDNDGDSDLVVLNAEGPAQVLLNTRGNRRPWIGVRAISKEGRDVAGGVVEVRRGGTGPRLVRRLGTDGSFASGRDPRVLVGLGDNPAVESVVVTWPDGPSETWTGLEVGRYHTLRQGTGSLRGTP